MARKDAFVRFATIWLSIGAIAYFFASVVFGAYVIPLELALFGFPPLENMLYPIRMSLIAWFAASFMYLMGQAALKRWSGVAIGTVSLVTSIIAYWPLVQRLNTIVVPWFLSLLELEFGTKLLIGAVFAIAYTYVALSPFVWLRYAKRKQIETPL
jgi:hypothetical protein